MGETVLDICADRNGGQFDLEQPSAASIAGTFTKAIRPTTVVFFNSSTWVFHRGVVARSSMVVHLCPNRKPGEEPRF